MQEKKKDTKQKLDEKTKDKMLYSIYEALDNTKGIGEKRRNDFMENFEKSIKENFMKGEK